MNSMPVNTRPRRAKREISPLDKKYDELMVFVKLKYGTPDCTADFFKKIPNTVIISAYNSFIRPNIHPEVSVLEQSDMLKFMLGAPWSVPRTKKAIQNALVEYHSK